MKLQGKIELLHLCASALHCVCAVVGVSVAACGLWVLFDSSFIRIISTGFLRVLQFFYNYKHSSISLVGVLLFSVGLAVVCVTVVGCVGSQRGSRILLLLELLVLVLLLLSLIFITLIILLKRDQISQTLSDNVDSIIKDFPKRERHLLDNMQHQVQCCGRLGPSDWLSNQFVISLNQSAVSVLPCSCFLSGAHSSAPFCSSNQSLSSEEIPYRPANSSFHKGCEVALRDWLEQNVQTIVGLDLGLGILQGLLLVVVASLYRSFGARASVRSELDQTGSDLVHNDEDLLYQDLDQDQDQDQGVYERP
uniref:Tetraspanin n=1 Tax=Knipowitschia caucasica TaxID=637954 RepID=A0AAV2MEH4_KNICA